MTLDIVAVLKDAWDAWKRDRAVLGPLAGLFLFLPVYGLDMLLPPPPAAFDDDANKAQQLAWAQSYLDWIGANGSWYLLVTVMVYFGLLTIYVFRLDPARPHLGGAMQRAAMLLLRYLLAMILIGIPAALGLMLFVLPGLYVLARVMVTGPAIVAEAPIGATRAIGRSVSLTKGHGLVLFGLAAITLIGGAVIAEPFLALDTAMRSGGMENKVAIALVDAAAAAATALSLLAMALTQVAVYRRLRGESSGI
jgi:hypothetical protein